MNRNPNYEKYENDDHYESYYDYDDIDDDNYENVNIDQYNITATSNELVSKNAAIYFRDFIKKYSNHLSTFFYVRQPSDVEESPVVISLEDGKTIYEPIKKTVYGTNLHIIPEADNRKLSDKYLLPYHLPYIQQWINKQNEWLEKVSDRQRVALNAYTYHGDKMINGYLRGTLREDCSGLIDAIKKSAENPLKYAIYDKYDYLMRKGLRLPPKSTLIVVNKIDNAKINQIIGENFDWFSKRSNLEILIVVLLEDITRVIYDTPRAAQDIIVYRGVKSAHNLSLKFRSNDYWSTSLNPYASIKFTKKLDSDMYFMLYEIRIPKNIPCIFLQKYSKFKSSEYEVLLPPGILYKMEKTVHIKTQLQSNLLNDNYTFSEYVQLINNDVARRRVGVIKINVEGYQPRIMNLKEIHDNWIRAKKRKIELKRRAIAKQDAIIALDELYDRKVPLHKERKKTRRFSIATTRSRKSRGTRGTRSNRPSRKMRNVRKEKSARDRGVLFTDLFSGKYFNKGKKTLRRNATRQVEQHRGRPASLNESRSSNFELEENQNY